MRHNSLSAPPTNWAVTSWGGVAVMSSPSTPPLKSLLTRPCNDNVVSTGHERPRWGAIASSFRYGERLSPRRRMGFFRYRRGCAPGAGAMAMDLEFTVDLAGVRQSVLGWQHHCWTGDSG